MQPAVALDSLALAFDSNVKPQNSNKGKLMNMKFYVYLSILFMLFIGSSAHSATASASVKVTAIIPDYMPDQIRFTVDDNIGTCNGGSWLDRYGKGADELTKRENNKIAYSTLLAALMSGKKVNVYVDDSNCQVTNLQFTDN